MKKLLTITAAIMITIFSIPTSAAETSVHGRLFANWMLNTSADVNNENEFGIGRAYLTVKSKLSDYSSVRVTTDIKNLDNYDGYSIILKYGYFDWKPKFAEGKLKIRFGLQPTPYIDMMNKFWGRRYMLKTTADLNKFLTTSDLGAGFIVGLGEKGKIGTVSLYILNGTSYSNVHEQNTKKDINGYVLLKPLTGNEKLKRSKVQGQVYLGTQNKTITDGQDVSAYKRQLISVGGLLGFQKSLDLGFDLNFLTKGQGYDELSGDALNDNKSQAISFFGTFYLKELVEKSSIIHTLNLFCRYDILDPNTTADNDAKKLLVVGVECNPIKGFKASLNYQSKIFDDDSDTESSVYIHTLFKF